MTDTIPEPLFMHEEPGDRFSVSQVADLMTRPNNTEAAKKTAMAQVRNFVSQNLLQIREKRGSGRTAHNLFAPSDVIVAKVLRTLTQLGISDRETLQTASNACYFFDGKPAFPFHPITTAIFYFYKGDEERGFWSFQLDVFTDPDGNRRLLANLYDPERFEVERDPRFQCDATVMIPVWQWFPTIIGPHPDDAKGMN